MKPKYLLLLVLLLVASIAFAQGGLFSQPPQAETPNDNSSTTPNDNSSTTPILTVHFIDVGQGDSIFIQGPKCVLIDGGVRGKGGAVVSYLQSLNVTRIDYVVATHPDADHIGGLINVLGSFNASCAPTVIESGATSATVTYQYYLSARQGRAVINASRGMVFTISEGINFTVYSPVQPIVSTDLNENSVVIKLCVFNASFLFMGDAGFAAEEGMLASGLDLDSDVLKVGHHGSASSSSNVFLEAVSPSISVVSVGASNRYGHPAPGTIERITSAGSAIYRTDLDGTVTIATDGDQLTVRAQK